MSNSDLYCKAESGRIQGAGCRVQGAGCRTKGWGEGEFV
jgi:hypothetical protein